MYTWVHLLVFVMLGGLASRLLLYAESHSNLGFAILLLFVVFEFGFVSVAFLVAEPILGLLAWPAVLAGNLLSCRRHGGLPILSASEHDDLALTDKA